MRCLSLALSALALVAPNLALGQASVQPAIPAIRANPTGARAALNAQSYVAVNDRTLANPAVGDGRYEPIQIGGIAGSPTLYLLHSDFLEITGTVTGGNTLTASPCVFRPEYSAAASNSQYRVYIPGTGAVTTVAASAATAAGTVAGTNNVLNLPGNVTSTYVSNITVVADTTTAGAIPAGTAVVSSVYSSGPNTTAVVLTNFVTGPGVGSGDTISATQLQAGDAVGSVATDGCSFVLSGGGVTNSPSGVPMRILLTPNYGATTTVPIGTASVGTRDQSYVGTGVSHTAGTATLSMPYPTLSPLRDNTYGTSLYTDNALKTTAYVVDTTTGCSFTAWMSSAASGTLGAAGIGTPDVATLDTTYPCNIATTDSVEVAWGRVIGGVTDTSNKTIHAGQSVEVNGTGIASTQMLPVVQEDTVSAATDPFTLTLGTNLHNTPAQAALPIYLRWGTDDTAAVEAAAAVAAGSGMSGNRTLYWPPGINTFMASAPSVYSSALDPVFAVDKCGEGRPIWPLNVDPFIGTHACVAGTPTVPPKTFSARQSLFQATAQAVAGSIPKFGVIGDSLFAVNNGLVGLQGSIVGGLKDAIDSANIGTGASPPSYNAIGGSLMAALAPSGPNLGNGQGIPSAACSTRPQFYQGATTQPTSAAPTSGSNLLTFASAAIAQTFQQAQTLTDATTGGVIPAKTYVKSISGAIVTMTQNAAATGTTTDSITGNMCNTPWLTIEEYAPTPIDTFLIRSSNDALGLGIGSLYDMVYESQTSAWNAVAGRYPDWVFFPGSNDFYGNGIGQTQGLMQNAGIQRTLVRSGFLSSIMHNQRSVGYVDQDRWSRMAEDGFDPVDVPARKAYDLGPTVAASNVFAQGVSSPYSIAEPGVGWEISGMTLRQSGASTPASTWFAALGGGITFEFGNGHQFTPTHVTGVGGPTTGYPNNAFVVGLTSGGNYSVSRYVDRFIETGTGVFTAGTNSSLVFGTAPAVGANMGHAGSQAWVCGAGIGSSTSPTWVGNGTALTNCVLGQIKPNGGVSADGKTLTFTGNVGSTVTSEAVTVGVFMAMPGDPTDTGCAPHLTNQGANTQVGMNFYVTPAGDVGFSEEAAYSGGAQCVWTGKMPVFMGGLASNLTIGTEDAFDFTQSVPSASGTVHPQLLLFATGNNPAIFRLTPTDSRLTPWITEAESWGLQIGGVGGSPGFYIGPFGGAGNAHAGSAGVDRVYKPLFDRQDWSTR
jgi:hypothetical protein